LPPPRNTSGNPTLTSMGNTNLLAPQYQFLNDTKPLSDCQLAVRANASDGGNGGLGTNVVFVTHNSSV